MKAAVLLNPFSGGSGDLPAVCQSIRSFLAGWETIGADYFGGDVFSPSVLIRTEPLPYVKRLQSAVKLIAAEGPDLFVAAGGDGFASYIADVLCRDKTGALPKIVGIAAGTANVGPIICIPARKLASLSPDSLSFAPCGAVEAFTGDRHIAFGFNDMVLGNTLLGTVNGTVCTLSASAMFKTGEKKPEKPLADLGNFRVRKNGKDAVNICHATSQIILSTLERERLYGRAVSGVLCFSQGTEEQAAVILSHRPLVTVEALPEGYDDFCPISQLLFRDSDTISIDGLAEDIMLIADGNPFSAEGGSVSFKYRKNLVMAACLQEVQ